MKIQSSNCHNLNINFHTCILFYVPPTGISSTHNCACDCSCCESTIKKGMFGQIVFSYLLTTHQSWSFHHVTHHLSTFQYFENSVSLSQQFLCVHLLRSDETFQLKPKNNVLNPYRRCTTQCQFYISTCVFKHYFLCPAPSFSLAVGGWGDDQNRFKSLCFFVFFFSPGSIVQKRNMQRYSRQSTGELIRFWSSLKVGGWNDRWVQGSPTGCGNIRTIYLTFALTHVIKHPKIIRKKLWGLFYAI